MIAQRGVAPALLDRLRRITDASQSALSLESLRSGTAVWVEGPEQYAELFPALAAARVEGARAQAFWSIPLIVEGQPVGLLAMGFYAARKFSPDDRSLAQTMAQQCAQALLRAERQRREDEARRWFSTTLLSIGDAVMATDEEGRITFMNPVAETLTGFTQTEARGQPLHDVFRIFSELTGEVVESPVSKVLREGVVVGLANHTVLRQKGGLLIPIDDSGAPIKNPDGKLIGVVLVFRDVSREKTERARADFLARVAQVLVESLDFEVTLGSIARSAVPILADWCAVDLIDRDSGELRLAAVAHVDPNKLELARNLRQRYPPDPRHPGGVAQVMRSGKSELYAEIPREMLEASAQDPEHLRLIQQLGLRSAIIVPLKAQGRCIGAMTFVHAESERRFDADDLAFAEDFATRANLAIENSLALREVEEARATEQRLRSEAEVANRAKDEFLAMVSHELRTPLNAIQGWTMILRSRNPPPQMDEGLIVIERNVHAQTKLIEDVLDVSRTIGGKLTLNPDSLDFAELVSSAVESISPTVRTKQIQMALEGTQIPVEMIADAHRMQQVVSNLLSNAVKFTPVGGRIQVRLQASEAGAVLEVADDGEGIDPEALPYIFEPFRQADASTTRRHGGLGLGLAIVKQIVLAHGGSVEATSEGVGRGCRFTVRLPLRATVPAVHRPGGTDPPPPVALPRLDRVKVLVVDDEGDARDLLCEVLKEQGAEVSSAASAAEAYAQLRDDCPHIIVSDIGMPGEDGYSLIRRVRELAPGEGGRTPAIALTAYARDIDVQRALEAGYQLHLTKPVNPTRLVSAIAELAGEVGVRPRD